MVSHWVKDKVHSARSTTTSGATKAGISNSEIINMGDWTEESTYGPVWDATVGWCNTKCIRIQGFLQ